MTELLLMFLFISMIFSVEPYLLSENISDVQNSLITTQLKAMASRNRVMMDSFICPDKNCWFNAKGNINASRTFIFLKGGKTYELVQWLGFGRFQITDWIHAD